MRLYRARKFTRTSYNGRALSNKMTGQIAIAIALPGLNDLGRSVIPVFLWWAIFVSNFLRLAKN